MPRVPYLIHCVFGIVLVKTPTDACALAKVLWNLRRDVSVLFVTQYIPDAKGKPVSSHIGAVALEGIYNCILKIVQAPPVFETSIVVTSPSKEPLKNIAPLDNDNVSLISKTIEVWAWSFDCIFKSINILLLDALVFTDEPPTTEKIPVPALEYK